MLREALTDKYPLTLIFLSATLLTHLVYDGYKMTPDIPSTQKVEELKEYITNKNIPAKFLEQKGYFSKGNSRDFLDICRNKYLVQEFSAKSKKELALLITNCVSQHAIARRHAFDQAVFLGALAGAMPRTTSAVIAVTN